MADTEVRERKTIRKIKNKEARAEEVHMVDPSIFSGTAVLD